MQPIVHTGRGFADRRVFHCGAPKQTGPGIIDLQLLLVPEGVLYRSNILATLVTRHKAYQAACNRKGRTWLPSGNPKYFSTEEDLHLLLLQTFKELIQSEKFWSDGQAAAQELQSKAKEFCNNNQLSYEENDWVFELMDRVFIGEMPGQDPRCYLVASAISCSGRFGLWQIPDQLEEDLAHLKSGDIPEQHDELVEKHLTVSRGTKPLLDTSFFSTVIPPSTMRLLDKLQQLESSSYENSLGQRYRLLFRTLSIEKRLAVVLLALELHVDPSGVLLHSNNVIMRPQNSGPQVNHNWFSSGSWRLGRQPAGLHTGSTAVLIDSLYMGDWQQSQTHDLFNFREDYENTHKVVRVMTEGVSLSPLKPYETHIETTLRQLQAVCQGMGWLVQLEDEVDDDNNSSSSSSHSLAVRLAYQYGWDYLGLLQNAQVIRNWWTQQTPEEQQTVQQQHSNIDLLKLIAQLGLPSSRVNSRTDMADCVSAVQQLYRQVLPGKDVQAALDVWMQSPRLQPHLSQITQHVDTAVAAASAAASAAAAAAQPGDAAGTSAAAVAPRQQLDIAPAAAAAVTLAAAVPKEGLVAPAALAVPEPLAHDHDDPSPGSAAVAPRQQLDIAPAAAAVTFTAAVPKEGLVAPAVLAVPEPLAHDHDDPSPGSAQPSRKQKGAAGLALAKQHAAARPSAAAAAATAAGQFDILDAAWRTKLRHTPAADFLHGGTQCVQQLLEDKGIKAVIDMGSASRATLRTMQSHGWIVLDYQKYTKAQPPATEWTGSRGITKWGAKLRLNYGGQHLEQHQWERLGEQLEVMFPSSEAVSNAKAFEDGFDLMAMVVESGFRTKRHATGYACESRGDGLRISIDSSNTHQLAEFREAAFWVTVLLLLLWHSQGRPTHPALQQVAKQYNLKDETPVNPSQPHTSTQLGRQGMQAALAAQRL